jgi:zinc protease
VKSVKSLLLGLALALTVPVTVAANPVPDPTPTPAAAVPAAAATPSASDLAEGRKIFAGLVAAYGGRAKLLAVRDLQTRGEVTAKTPQGDMSMDVQTAIIFPDRISQQVDAPFGRVAMVATPDEAFLSGPSGNQGLPAPIRDEMLKQIRRTPLYLLQKEDDPKLALAAAGTEKIGDVDSRILDISYGDMSVRWFVDAASGRILRAEHTATAPGGSRVRVVADYSDFRTVDGFPIPFHLDATTNGEKDQSLALEEYRINSGVSPALFEKPPTPAPTITPTAGAPKTATPAARPRKK